MPTTVVVGMHPCDHLCYTTSKVGTNSFLSFPNLISFTNVNHTKTKRSGPFLKSTHLCICICSYTCTLSFLGKHLESHVNIQFSYFQCCIRQRVKLRCSYQLALLATLYGLDIQENDIQETAWYTRKCKDRICYLRCILPHTG